MVVGITHMLASLLPLSAWAMVFQINVVVSITHMLAFQLSLCMDDAISDNVMASNV